MIQILIINSLLYNFIFFPSSVEYVQKISINTKNTQNIIFKQIWRTKWNRQSNFKQCLGQVCIKFALMLIKKPMNPSPIQAFGKIAELTGVFSFGWQPVQETDNSHSKPRSLFIGNQPCMNGIHTVTYIGHAGYPLLPNRPKTFLTIQAKRSKN